nr:uncharacterized mitochondrial protein AtMg00810-like [Tanacetum cinerariifolium]
LNASYVNEKIKFEDDYFQEIINPDFEKIDSLYQQTSSLKPYVPNVIIEKIIIDLEDKVVNLLEKEKDNLEIIESLKSKGFELSENVSSESENQTKNYCLVVEKECDKEENPKVIAHGIFKLNVSQCVSPISMMNDLLDDNNFFIFDDVNVRISLVRKMPLRKKPCDSMHIVQICLWIIDSGCSKHMTGNRALLTNFVEKFLGTVHFGNNDFAMIVGYGDVVIVPTPMVEQAKLKLDFVRKLVDHTDYRSMIGSLMYVTSSRPDIMFSTCMCARYQANPNEHHVSAVKRIFRYLKRTINLGLWYSKDSGFDLTAYSDADHAGCHLDRKSTSGSV